MSSVARALLAPVPQRPDFRDVYTLELDYVWRSLRRLGAPERELPDLTQEVFLVVHKRLHGFDPSRPLKPWLFGIAFRVMSEYRAKPAQRREHSSVALDHLMVEPDAEHHLDKREARELVLTALQRVHETRRPVVILHDLDGYAAPDIARALSLPLNTVYSRLRVGRDELVKAVRRLRGAGADHE